MVHAHTLCRYRHISPSVTEGVAVLPKPNVALLRYPNQVIAVPECNQVVSPKHNQLLKTEKSLKTTWVNCLQCINHSATMTLCLSVKKKKKVVALR